MGSNATRKSVCRSWAEPLRASGVRSEVRIDATDGDGVLTRQQCPKSRRDAKAITIVHPDHRPP